jgi:hypothetical protein
VKSARDDSFGPADPGVNQEAGSQMSFDLPKGQPALVLTKAAALVGVN